MKFFTTQRRPLSIKIIDIILVFVLVANIVFVLPFSQGEEKEVFAASAELTAAEATVQTTITNLTNTQTTLQTLQTQTQTSAKQVVTTAVNQALGATSVDPTKLTSVANLNVSTLENMATAAVTDAVGSGATTLSQITSAGKISIPDAQKLVTSAVSEAIGVGSIDLSQLKNISIAQTPQIQNVVNGAIEEAIGAGKINVTQIQGISSLSTSQIQSMVTKSLNEAISNASITLTAPQFDLVINQSVSSLKSAVGTINVDTLKNAVATQIVGVTGLSSVSTLVSKMGVTTQIEFAKTVKDQLVSQALSQVKGITGVIDINNIKDSVATQALALTGLGDVTQIKGAIGAITNGNFSNMVKDAVIGQALSQVKSITGIVDLANVKTSIANGVLAATGLGNIAIIKGSLGAMTSGEFLNTVKSTAVNEAMNSLKSLTGVPDLTAMKNALATNILGTTGLGSMTSIIGSLSSVNPTAITAAIKDSLVQQALGQLPSLPSLSVANIENLIGGNIMNLTGTGNLANITSAISDNLSSAIGSITSVQTQLTQAFAQLQGSLTDLLDLSSKLNGLTSSVLSAVDLSSLTSSMTNITNFTSGIMGTVTGPLSAVVSSISSTASTIFTNGTASLLEATGLSAAVSSLSSSVSSVLGDTEGINLGSSYTGGSTISSPGGGQPFGGRITSVFWCNCSMNLRLTVSGPRGGIYMYQPGATRLYQYGQIYRAGVWLLGLYGSPVQCRIIIPKGCATLGSWPMITMTGTSM